RLRARDRDGGSAAAPPLGERQRRGSAAPSGGAVPPPRRPGGFQAAASVIRRWRWCEAGGGQLQGNPGQGLHEDGDAADGNGDRGGPPVRSHVRAVGEGAERGGSGDRAPDLRRPPPPCGRGGGSCRSGVFEPFQEHPLQPQDGGSLPRHVPAGGAGGPRLRAVRLPRRMERRLHRRKQERRWWWWWRWWCGCSSRYSRVADGGKRRPPTRLREGTSGRPLGQGRPARRGPRSIPVLGGRLRRAGNPGQAAGSPGVSGAFRGRLDGDRGRDRAGADSFARVRFSARRSLRGRRSRPLSSGRERLRPRLRPRWRRFQYSREARWRWQRQQRQRWQERVRWRSGRWTQREHRCRAHRSPRAGGWRRGRPSFRDHRAFGEDQQAARTSTSIGLSRWRRHRRWRGQRAFPGEESVLRRLRRRTRRERQRQRRVREPLDRELRVQGQGQAGQGAQEGRQRACGRRSPPGRHQPLLFFLLFMFRWHRRPSEELDQGGGLRRMPQGSGVCALRAGVRGPPRVLRPGPWGLCSAASRHVLGEPVVKGDGWAWFGTCGECRCRRKCFFFFSHHPL
ncbi:unnamed protein product, partial [Scytosiphon promiscuus]